MKSRVWVGVDPGRSGAMALIEVRSEAAAWSNAEPTRVEAWPTPMLDAKQYDITGIAQWFRSWQPQIALVTVELLHPMPATFRGGAANFGRGESRGWLWMLAGLGIPFLPVVPQTWQRIMHARSKGATTKARSIDTALRLFTGVSLLESNRAKKHSDGLADAVCLAEYGRRTHRRIGA